MTFDSSDAHRDAKQEDIVFSTYLGPPVDEPTEEESQFFKNLSIIGGFVLLFATGSGRFGLDALLARRKGNSRSA